MVGGKFWFIFPLLIPGVAITGQDKTNDHQEADQGIENGTIDPSTLKSPSQTDIVDAKMDNGTTDAASLSTNDTGTNGTNTTYTHQEAEKAMANATIDSDTSLPSLPNQTSTQTSAIETKMGGTSTDAQTATEATCQWVRVRVCEVGMPQSLANESHWDEAQLMMYAASKTNTSSTSTTTTSTTTSTATTTKNKEKERKQKVLNNIKRAKGSLEMGGTAFTGSATAANAILDLTVGSELSLTKQHEALILEQEELIGSNEYAAKEQDKIAAEKDADAAKEDKLAKEAKNKKDKDAHKGKAKTHREKADKARSNSKKFATKASNGKTALTTTKKIGPFAQKAHTVGKAIKTIGKVLSAVGSVLSAVSAVMSFVSIFLPQPESPELQEIKEMRKEMEKGFQEVKEEMRIGFKAMEKGFADVRMEMKEGFADVKKTIQEGFAEMHGRFDKIERRLDRLQQHIELTPAINAYREKRVVIKALKRFYFFVFKNLSTVAMVNFHDQCREHNPLILLYWFHDYMIDNVPTGKPGGMLDSILTVANYSMTVVVEWQTLISQDVSDLARVHAGCLGIASRGNTQDPYVVAMIKETDEIVQKIKEKMSNTTTYFEENFHELAAYKEIQQIQNLSGIVSSDNNWHSLSREIYVHLITKYDFVEWAILPSLPRKLPPGCTQLKPSVPHLDLVTVCWCKPVTLEQRAIWLRSRCHGAYSTAYAYNSWVFNSAEWVNTTDIRDWSRALGENVTDEGYCSVIADDRQFYMIRPVPPTDANCFVNDTEANEQKAP